MTKYILHGGETGIKNEHNKKFYQEWVKGFDDDFVPTILLVYYSRPKERWDELERSDKERFANYTNNREVSFVLADSNLDVFRKQVEEADVVYVRGGSSENVFTAFAPIKDELKEMLEGKVYAGSSAGVMILSHYTRSHESDWREGLGILPINSVVHWSPELEESFNNFKAKHPDSECEYLLLPETEFVVKEY